VKPGATSGYLGASAGHLYPDLRMPDDFWSGMLSEVKQLLVFYNQACGRKFCVNGGKEPAASVWWLLSDIE